MTFLDYYRSNLAHIRGIANEFAAEFPKIAERLELSEYNCQDPYVERILEGTAFLAARVEHKLESGFPRFLETVSSSVAPQLTAPIPSYAVVNCVPDYADERLRDVYVMKRGTTFKCKVPGVETPCVYSTIIDVSVGAAVLRSARYEIRDFDSLGIDDRSAGAALVMEVIDADGVGGAAMPDDLLAYLDMPDSMASAMQGQLCGDLRGIYLRHGDKTVKLESSTVDVPMFTENCERRFRVPNGVQAMVWFMACPRLFKFFRVKGVKAAFNAIGGAPGELIFVFARREDMFIRAIDAKSIKLGCVPVANMFIRRSDRTECNGAFEHHVTPDRSAPMDMEVLSVESVEAYDARNQVVFCAQANYRGEGDNHFVTHRRARLFNPDHSRSSYHGTEMFVSLAGKDYDLHHDEIRQVGALLYCTNRDLPLLIRADDPVFPPVEEPIASAAFVGTPSPPSPPLITGGAAEDWEKVGMVSTNLSSVLWRNGMIPADIIRKMIRMYANEEESVARRLADAIVTVVSTPRIFRFVSGGTPYFESGWRLDLTLNEDFCSGTGVFIFARILGEFFASFVPINTCVEFVVSTDRRKEAFRWQL